MADDPVSHRRGDGGLVAEHAVRAAVAEHAVRAAGSAPRYRAAGPRSSGSGSSGPGDEAGVRGGDHQHRQWLRWCGPRADPLRCGDHRSHCAASPGAQLIRSAGSIGRCSGRSRFTLSRNQRARGGRRPRGRPARRIDPAQPARSASTVAGISGVCSNNARTRGSKTVNEFCPACALLRRRLRIHRRDHPVPRDRQPGRDPCLRHPDQPRNVPTSAERRGPGPRSSAHTLRIGAMLIERAAASPDPAVLGTGGSNAARSLLFPGSEYPLASKASCSRT